MAIRTQGDRQLGDPTPGIDRRQFTSLLVGAIGASLLTGCEAPNDPNRGNGSARLTARPGVPSLTIAPGSYQLGLATPRDGILFVPPQYDPQVPMPMLLALHGGGGSANGPINFFAPYARQVGFIVLAVDARGGSWDGILGRFEFDPPFIEQALAWTFARCRVDPARVWLEGASDGGTYSFGIGLANGDLFRRVVAFIPAGLSESDSPRVAKPEFFIASGKQDPIFSIETIRGVTVPGLRGDGYQVEFVEFDGGHTIPAEVADQAVAWMVRP